MKKNIQMHNESIHKKKVDAPKDGSALPAYLLDREVVTRAKVLSNSLKQKRKEKAGKWNVPLPRLVQVRNV
jgi:ribosome biogenesis protein NSA2